MPSIGIREIHVVLTATVLETSFAGFPRFLPASVTSYREAADGMALQKE